MHGLTWFIDGISCFNHLTFCCLLFTMCMSFFLVLACLMLCFVFTLEIWKTTAFRQSWKQKSPERQKGIFRGQLTANLLHLFSLNRFTRFLKSTVLCYMTPFKVFTYSGCECLPFQAFWHIFTACLLLHYDSSLSSLVACRKGPCHVPPASYFNEDIASIVACVRVYTFPLWIIPLSLTGAGKK